MVGLPMSNSTEIRLEKTHGEARRAVLKGLMAFNRSKAGKIFYKKLTLTVRDGNRIAGGVTAEVYGPTLFVDLLWIEEELRGRDIGTQLMDAVEAEGRKLGAQRCLLDTYSFQARPFYEKRGYAVFGTFDEFLLDTKRFWLQKGL